MTLFGDSIFKGKINLNEALGWANTDQSTLAAVPVEGSNLDTGDSETKRGKAMQRHREKTAIYKPTRNTEHSLLHHPFTAGHRHLGLPVTLVQRSVPVGWTTQFPVLYGTGPHQ